MAWAPDYVTLPELKAHLRIEDTADDTALAGVITAASRAIDHETGRQFGQVTEAVARLYSYDHHLVLDGQAALPIDDVYSTTGMIVAVDNEDDGTYGTIIVEGTDWTLWPRNAPLDGKPWTHLLSLGRSVNPLPRYPDSIRVTALWGWESVPSVVSQACLIQSARFFVRRDSAYGVAGSPEIGSEMRLLDRLDPDVALLLSSVKRRWAAV